jgi:hypothetical protein
MALLPWPSALVEQVAWPLPFSPTLLQIVAPLDVNVTEPVGVEVADTLAVKVTGLPAIDGFVGLLMVVVVEVREAYVIVTDQLVIDIGLVTPFPLITVKVHVPFAVVVPYLLVSVGGEVQLTALL